MLNLQEQTTLDTLTNSLQTFIDQGCERNDGKCFKCNRSINTNEGYYCGASRMMNILDDIKRNIQEE